MGTRRTIRRVGQMAMAAAVAALTLNLAPQPASAAILTVNSADVVVADDGQCTLPEAITAANTDTASGASPGECIAGAAFDFIGFSAGFTISVPAGGLPPVTSTMNVSSGSGVIIDGTNAGPVPGLTIQSASTVTLMGLVIRGFEGGGIVATDTVLTVNQNWIDGNGSELGPDGGISFESTGATRYDLFLMNSTVSNNATSTSGGGVLIDGLVNASIVNTTIANNVAVDNGGGIYYSPTAGASLMISQTTIVGNEAVDGTGVLHAGLSTIAVTNSIIADNLGIGGDVDGGVYNSGGGNVIGTGNGTADFTAANDIIGQPAGVAPLADNGGVGPTMALLPTSAAVDRVTSANPLSIDQRSVTRPQGALPDSGAYELRSELIMLPKPCVSYVSALDGGALDGGETRTIQITGRCGIPTDATSVVFTVVAKNPLAPGNLRLSATGVVPNGGVVNFADNDLENSNTVIVELSPTGKIDLGANGGSAGVGIPLTNVNIHAVAYYSSTAGLGYFPLTPCAVADSRPTEGATGSFVGPFSDTDPMPAIDVVNAIAPAQGGGNSDCRVPDGAEAVVVNLVAVNATGPGTVVVPGAILGANILAFDAIGMNNSVVAYRNLDGGQTIEFDVSTTAGTHVRVVVLGYLDDVGTTYVAVTPCAAFDTRATEGATGAFAGLRNGDDVTTYQITGTIPAAQGGNGGNCGVPTTATAVLINLVAVNSVLPGNLQAYAAGTTATGGVVNFAPLTPAMNNANAVPISINVSGQLDVRTNAGPTGVGLPATHIRGVVLGYYTE